jgi:sigma-B regulation protein RsbU (phosphoserine phosphatase)
MATKAATRFSERMIGLVPRLAQAEISPEWRNRMRWLKLFAIILVLLSPAIVSLAGQLAGKLGRARSLEIGLGLVMVPAMAAGALAGARALKNRRETRFERSSAQAIQRLILPQELPVCRGFGLAAVCRTYREVGGDYYDAIPLAHDRILLAIADVAGKGMPAALVTSGIHAIMRTQADAGRPLADIAQMLANYLSRHTQRYATMVFGILDLKTRGFTYVNAGHNPPLLLRDNGALQLLHAAGPPIGLLPDIHYTEETVALGPGDRLLFYTDGLTDRPSRNHDTYGEERLVNALRACAHASPTHMTELILLANDQFAQQTPPDDDISLLIVKCYKA